MGRQTEKKMKMKLLFLLSYLFFIALLLSGGIFVFFFFSRLCSSHTEEMDSAPPTATTPLGQSLIDPFPSISFDRWQPTAWRSDAASCVFRGLPTSRLILPFFLLLLRGWLYRVCIFSSSSFLFYASSLPVSGSQSNQIRLRLSTPTPPNQRNISFSSFIFYFLQDVSWATILFFYVVGCLRNKQTKTRIRDPQTVGTVRFCLHSFSFVFVFLPRILRLVEYAFSTSPGSGGRPSFLISSLQKSDGLFFVLLRDLFPFFKYHR